MTKAKQTELISKLSEIAAELNWKIAFDSDSDKVTGLIMGNTDFIREAIESIDYMEFDVMYFEKDQKEIH